MVELTKRERRLTSFPTRKISVGEARKSLSRAVDLILIAKYELEDAKLELDNAISHLRDSYSSMTWREFIEGHEGETGVLEIVNGDFALHNTERLEKASKWVHSANKRYYERRRDLSAIKNRCHESEIPFDAVKDILEVLEKCEN